MLLGNISKRPGHSLFLTDTEVFMTSLKCILVRINLTGQAVLLACSQGRYGLAELRGYLHPGSARPFALWMRSGGSQRGSGSPVTQLTCAEMKENPGLPTHSLWPRCPKYSDRPAHPYVTKEVLNRIRRVSNLSPHHLCKCLMGSRMGGEAEARLKQGFSV